DDLRQYVSDILWSLKTTTGDDGYIHLLLAHQSSADKIVAFRQLRSCCRRHATHLKRVIKNLPLVIRFCFTTAAGVRTRSPTNWLDCFSNPDRPEKYTRQDSRWLMSPSSMMMR
ncbi:Rpn family recombination-promoting nuclease/putative transposase, partial [Klebsiella pneumoniae]|uniref:Rpn family recombination-promoting nuclease/putative transposase n=1 Tax=Klebsiella pneumoniae TaxID=573 RepID=UPI001F5767DE